jgi:uncharacterized cupin superfamily protein
VGGVAIAQTYRARLDSVPEAPLQDTPSGLAPAGDGWFVVNARDAVWLRLDRRGTRCAFESESNPFPQLGFALHVLEPGQPSGLYHAESEQEAFLVLAGECRLIVEDIERILVPWDFFHCPAGTAHTMVGAGDGPCVILMTGSRSDEMTGRYPVSEPAANHGASVAVETTDPDEAYAGFVLGRWERAPSWDGAPWA